jgi:hypothetical protein
LCPSCNLEGKGSSCRQRLLTRSFTSELLLSPWVLRRKSPLYPLHEELVLYTTGEGGWERGRISPIIKHSLMPNPLVYGGAANSIGSISNMTPPKYICQPCSSKGEKSCILQGWGKKSTGVEWRSEDQSSDCFHSSCRDIFVAS